MLKPVLTIAVLLLSVGLLAPTLETLFIYPFDETHVLPADAGEPRLTEVALDTPDGEVLILWVAAPKSGRPTILYFHGNAGNLAVRTARFSYFLDRGYGVIAPAYRGSSGSTGTPNEDDLIQDGLLVFDAFPDLIGTENSRVILYGESLGTALATRIAVEREASAVILEAPFTSLVELGKSLYYGLDTSSILTQFWDSAAIIHDMQEPLLVLHGTDDKLVPFAQGQQILKLAGSRDKQMITLRGTGHTGVWTTKGIAAITAFIDRIYSEE